MPSDLMGNHLSMWDERTEADIRIAQGFLARFRFPQPDWHFDITRRPEVGCARLRIQVWVVDSRVGYPDLSGFPRGMQVQWVTPEGLKMTAEVEPKAPRIRIQGEYNLPRLSEMQHPEKLFQDFLRHSIRDVVCHEADEWFRVDGKLPFDPHRGER